MATKIAIDDHLLELAVRLGGHSNPREAVEKALQEYVARRQRIAIENAFGTFDFDENYD